MLLSPPELVDEHGVPLALYAARPLLETAASRDDIIAHIRKATDETLACPPAALRMARDLAGVVAPDLVDGLQGLIRERERAEALQRDLPRAVSLLQMREPVWTSYGDPAWLVSVTPPVSNFDGLVIAVDAREILGRTGSSAHPLRLAAALEPAEKLLGEGFPGLRVAMLGSPEPKTGSRQTFLVLALVLALVLILLAGYLLQRDVQRDLKLAEMRSQFVSSVTHELKTPLTAIRMFAETLRLDDDLDRRTRDEYVDTILHESERLSRLVDNILEFGKIERGRKTYRFQPVRLHEVVEEAARTAQYPLAQAGFTLDIATQPDMPSVSGDADALHQAILNLLTNAMKYSGDARRIGLQLDRADGQARIHVVDQGVGISAEHQERIFESFYRAPTSENQSIPGTGLGLTIVAHIAKAHGGAVRVASDVGRGSVFTLELPLTREELA